MFYGLSAHMHTNIYAYVHKLHVCMPLLLRDCARRLYCNCFECIFHFSLSLSRTPFFSLSRSLALLSSFRSPCLHRNDNEQKEEKVELTNDKQNLEAAAKASEDVPKSSEQEDDVRFGTNPAMLRALDLPAAEV